MLAILQSSIEPSPLTTPSACPEALLAEGFTGKLPMLDGEIGRPRTIIDIEKAAKLRTDAPLSASSNGQHALKWTLRP